MQPADDGALLRQYGENHSDEAFAALVTRHINLVYSVALRHVGNPHHAEEITQAVFIILAKKALQLRHDKALSSWLFQATRWTANNFMRSEARRHRREQEAYMQTVLNESGGSTWRQIAPLLDTAVAALNEKDRRAIVLRFYEGRNLLEVGAALGASEEAAKKRVARGLERLQKYFSKRGVNSTAATIAETISSHSVQVAPAVLAKSVTVVALAKGATASTSTLTLIKGALKIMAWTKAKTAVVAVTAVIVATGTTIVMNKAGVFGSGRPNARVSETLAKAGASPRIFSNGINLAHEIPDAIYTYPDGDERTHRYVENILKKFAKNMGPGRTIKSDRELTEQDLQTRTIYIYGSPENHSLFQRVRDQLPIVFEDDGIVVGRKKCLGRDVGAIFVCPNPLNPDNRLVIYGTVSPDALNDMNAVFHGPTDYVVFNNTTRQFRRVNSADQFLLAGSFDKSDPAHWQVDESLQVLPPKALQRATANVVVAK